MKHTFKKSLLDGVSALSLDMIPTGDTIAETLRLNEESGIKIGDKTYDLEIVAWDTQDNTPRTKEGMEKMVQESIHYVVGPNTALNR